MIKRLELTRQKDERPLGFWIMTGLSGYSFAASILSLFFDNFPAATLYGMGFGVFGALSLLEWGEERKERKTCGR